MPLRTAKASGHPGDHAILQRMGGRFSLSWFAVASVLIVTTILADIVRRAWSAADTAPVASSAQESLAGAPDTSAPAPRPVPAAGSVPAGPGYIEQLAHAETRRRLRASAGITYLNDFLATSTDSMLHRWNNRITNPVRVYVGPGRAANYQPEYADAIRWAFTRWVDAGVPVRFNLHADSTTAEVRIRWRVQFDIDRTGQTDLTWNGEGHIETGVITFATFDPLGRPMTTDDIRIVALHEIGHLLGLDHSPDSSDVMFPVSRVRDLSGRDIQSALVLYALAPGPLR